MTVYRLGPEVIFPEPEEAEASGLLAVGGDLRPERLLLAYARGIFPWFSEPPILWFSPDPRAVVRPADLQVPRRLERTLRQNKFEVTLDRAFGEVIRSCANTPRPEQDGTWITPEMIAGYEALFELGFAHSCEAWCDGRLAGGIYGVSLGRVFFGESMFYRERDASKVAWVTLARQLLRWDFELFDCQLDNGHLRRFGVVTWPRAKYLEALRQALTHPTLRGRWQLDPVGAQPVE